MTLIEILFPISNWLELEEEVVFKMFLSLCIKLELFLENIFNCPKRYSHVGQFSKQRIHVEPLGENEKYLFVSLGAVEPEPLNNSAYPHYLNLLDKEDDDDGGSGVST